MPLTELEARWLEDWARPIVAVSSQHRQDCERSGGATGEPRLDSNLRWPGYIGSRFESARLRILCIAQIHHGPELHRTLGHVQESMRQWVDREIDDEIFFGTLQRAYQAAIIEWGPWKKTFAKLLSGRGIDETAISYTNFA